MRCERCAIIRTLLVLMPAQSCYDWIEAAVGFSV